MQLGVFIDNERLLCVSGKLNGFGFQPEASCIAAKETSSDRYDQNLEPQECCKWWERMYYQLSKEFWVLGDKVSFLNVLFAKDCVANWESKKGDLPKERIEEALPAIYLLWFRHVWSLYDQRKENRI